MSNVCLKLPQELISSVLILWTSLPDLTKIDTAFCNKYNRPHFIQVLNENRSIHSGNYELELDNLFIAWQIKRKIPVYYIKLKGHLSDAVSFNETCHSCLYSLEFKPTDMLSVVFMAHSLRYCKHLEHFALGTIYQPFYTEKRAELIILALCEHCKYISILRINLNFGLTEAALNAIGDNLHHLECFDLDATGPGSISNAAMIRLAIGCPKLRSLDIATCRVSDLTDEFVIALSRNCLDLRSLIMHYCPNITDIAFYSLAEHSNYLEHLDVNCDSNVTDKSLIEVVRKCKHLKSLKLFHNNQITDTLIKNIATYALELQSLEIQGKCDLLTEKCLESVGKGCPKLEYFFCDKPYWIEGLKALKVKRPELDLFTSERSF